MKRNRITAGLTLLILVMCACLSHAQSTPRTWAYTGLLDLKSRKVSSVILAPTGTVYDVGSLTANVPDVPKFHFSLYVQPLVGVTADGGATAGIAAVHPFALTKDRKWNLILGGYGRVQNHTPIITGLIFGLAVQLG